MGMYKIYKRRFLDAILKDREKFEIGEFVIFRNSKTGFANILTKDTYDQGKGSYKNIKEKIKEDEKRFKIIPVEHITDEDLENIE